MSIKMSREIAQGLKKSFFNNRIVLPLIIFWLMIGMPAFVASVTSEFVEVYLEKFIPAKNQPEAAPK